MVRIKPKNYSCSRCHRNQYTTEKCHGCGSKVFVEVKYSENYTITFTEEELGIIQNWGFIVTTERPLSKQEKELYSKITNA